MGGEKCHQGAKAELVVDCQITADQKQQKRPQSLEEITGKFNAVFVEAEGDGNMVEFSY
jgi:hypothetical protein